MATNADGDGKGEAKGIDSEIKNDAVVNTAAVAAEVVEKIDATAVTVTATGVVATDASTPSIAPSAGTVKVQFSIGRKKKKQPSSSRAAAAALAAASGGGGAHGLSSSSALFGDEYSTTAEAAAAASARRAERGEVLVIPCRSEGGDTNVEGVERRPLLEARRTRLEAAPVDVSAGQGAGNSGAAAASALAPGAQKLANGAGGDKNDAEAVKRLIEAAAGTGDSGTGGGDSELTIAAANKATASAAAAVDDEELFRRDLSSHAEDIAPDSDAYASVAVGDFGSALLRGMGWKSGTDSGASSKDAPPKPRHHRLGLGAVPKMKVPLSSGDAGGGGALRHRRARRPEEVAKEEARIREEEERERLSEEKKRLDRQHTLKPGSIVCVRSEEQNGGIGRESRDEGKMRASVIKSAGVPGLNRILIRFEGEMEDVSVVKRTVSLLTWKELEAEPFREGKVKEQVGREGGQKVREERGENTSCHDDVGGRGRNERDQQRPTTSSGRRNGSSSNDENDGDGGGGRQPRRRKRSQIRSRSGSSTRSNNGRYNERTSRRMHDDRRDENGQRATKQTHGRTDDDCDRYKDGRNLNEDDRPRRTRSSSRDRRKNDRGNRNSPSRDRRKERINDKDATSRDRRRERSRDGHPSSRDLRKERGGDGDFSRDRQQRERGEDRDRSPSRDKRKKRSRDRKSPSQDRRKERSRDGRSSSHNRRRERDRGHGGRDEDVDNQHSSKTRRRSSSSSRGKKRKSSKRDRRGDEVGSHRRDEKRQRKQQQPQERQQQQHLRWLLPNIRVRLVGPRLRKGRRSPQSGIVQDVLHGGSEAVVLASDGEVLTGVSERHLEPASPDRLGGCVVVLEGPRRGERGRLLERTEDSDVCGRLSVVVQLYEEMDVVQLPLDGIAEWCGHPDDDMG